MAEGKNNDKLEIEDWYLTISSKLKELLTKKIGNNRVIKHISKDNTWAAPLRLPNKEYLELLDQPAKMMPKTLKEEIPKKSMKFKYPSKYMRVELKDIKLIRRRLIKKQIKGASMKK